MLKRLVKQRKHYLSLAKRIFSENRRPKIFSKNGRFSAKKGGLESSQFSLRTILVITFYIKVLKHSEKLSLQSSGTKNHWHLNIKAFDRDLHNNTTDSTNTCEHLCPLPCAEIFPEVLVGMIIAILD